MSRVVLATANPHKAREIAAVLALDGVVVDPRPDTIGEVDETGDTLEENALLKAHAVASAAGCAAIGDDTGLFVDALDGAPGVYSARYAGPDATYEDNVRKLVGALEDVEGRRTARFVTVAAFVDVDGREVLATGVLEGEIVRSPRGTNGFGYDPVFVPDGGNGRTLAELTDDEKNERSHRGLAFRALAAALRDAGGPRPDGVR